jgi:hypothetical protein
LCRIFSSLSEPTRNGIDSVPSIGSSPICWMLRISASGTSPSRTARSCSGPLKPSEPPACTVIFTSPPVALPTSSAKRLALVVWKFPSGQTVARSRLVAADAGSVVLARTAAVPTMKSRRVNMIDSLCTVSRLFSLPRAYSAASPLA